MRLYVETYGCSYNQADSEYIKTIADAEESTLEKADIIIINTCTVKDKTVSNFKKRLKEIESLNPKAKIIIAGCMAQATKKAGFELNEMKNYSLMGPNNYGDVNEIINSNSILKKIDDEGSDSLNTTSSKPIETIPISKGCLNQCTYCQTKLARGKLVSFKPERIINRIKTAVENGTKIIYLTSQDNGCYGFDFNNEYFLPNLLNDICKLDRNFTIRIGMANPAHLNRIKNAMVKAMQNEKIFNFLHIPAQSGSNNVLRDMRRGNTNEQFLELVDFFKQQIPNLTIATDIIVGFPTETEEDFQETLIMLKELKPDVVNRAKFSARPGTKAKEMKQLSTNEITRRSKILNTLVEELSKEKNYDLKGWEGTAIVEAKKKEGTVVARTPSYKPVIVEGNFKIGEKLKVKVQETKTFHSIGALL
jgi:threonylcarbamoyladenosine tRNA methylthiotransferase CDKAL1